MCEIELAYADPAQAERFIAEVWVLLEETASIPSPKVSAKGAGSALALTFEQRAYAESVFGRLLRNYPAMKLAADERQSGKTHQWRAWADELRATADQLTHPSAREALLRAAANYDRLADRDEGKPSDAQRPENKRTG